MVNIKEPRDAGAIPAPGTRVIHIVIFLDPQYNIIIVISCGFYGKV